MQAIQRSDVHFCLWDIYQLFLLVSEFLWHMPKQNILLIGELAPLLSRLGT
jgi:hypothetical protein